MSDQARSMVAQYNEPRTSGEMARLIEIFMTASFQQSCAGGCNDEGGDMTFDLDDQEVAVVVMPLDEWIEAKRTLRAIRDGKAKAPSVN